MVKKYKQFIERGDLVEFMKIEKSFQLITSIAVGFAAGITMALTSFLDHNVKISKKKLVMEIGETATLKTVREQKKIRWKTSNERIVVVSAEGKITAKSEGTAGVMADVNGKKYVWPVVVRGTCHAMPEGKAKEWKKPVEEEKKQNIPAYTRYGVTFDEDAQGWKYDGKRVAVLYDQKGYIFSDDSVPEEEAVYLEVLRDIHGDIEYLKRLTGGEAQKIYEGRGR